MRILYSGCLDFYFDQLNSSSCSANSITIILYLLMKKYNIHPFICSRLFIYYNGREYLNDTKKDKGTTDSGLFYSLKTYGICPESLCPYDLTKITEKPNKVAYQFGSKFPVKIYFSKNYLFQKNWIELVSKTLLNRQFILISMKRDDEISNSFNPVGSFNTFPIVEYIKYYHHIICIGIDTDEKLVYLLNSHGQKNNNIVTVTFNEIEQLNPLEPDICIVDADFSQCNHSIFYQFSFDKYNFFNYSFTTIQYKNVIDSLQPILNEQFGNQWCFHNETLLFLLYEHYQPQDIPNLDFRKINVLVPQNTTFQHPQCSITVDNTISRKYLLFCISILKWNDDYDKIIKIITSYNHKVLVLTNKENILSIPKKNSIQVVLDKKLDNTIIQQTMKLFNISYEKNVFLINEKTYLQYNNIQGTLNEIFFRIYDTIIFNNYNIVSFHNYPILDIDIQIQNCKNSQMKQYFQKISSSYKSCIFHVKNPFHVEKQYVDTEIKYDHVIIGTELIGRYMAYQLQKQFPHESILIIDENRMENNSTCFPQDFILPFKNIRTINEKHLLTRKLFQEFNLKLKKEKNVDNFILLKENEKKQICKILFKNYTIDVEFLFNQEEDIHVDKMFLILNTLSNIEELCITTDYDYFTSYGMNITSIKNRKKVVHFNIVSEHCCRMNENSSAFDFLLSCIFSNTSVYPIEKKMSMLQSKLLANFSCQDFGSFLMENEQEQYCILNNVSVTEINSKENTISSCVTLDSCIHSSLFTIHYKELYNCSLDEKLLPKNTISKCSFSLHVSFPNTNDNYNFFKNQNHVYYMDSDFIWISFDNVENCIQQIKKEFYFLNDFYYEFDSIPSCYESLENNIPLLQEKRDCIGFVITSQTTISFSDKNSFYKNKNLLLNNSSTVHSFPMNINLFSNCIETSLYLVDTYFSQIKRIGILDNVKNSFNYVGFHIEYNLENCHFIYSPFMVKNDKILVHKPIVFYGDAFHYELYKDGHKCHSFAKPHCGYFDVYCSLTNKIKYEGLYFDNEKGVPYDDSYKSEIYTVLTYYIWEGKKYIASFRHRFQKQFGFEYFLFNSNCKEYKNHMNFLKSL